MLCDIIGPNCYDLGALIHGPIKDQQEFKVLIQELQYVLENICYHITEIMVTLFCHYQLFECWVIC